MAKKSEEKLLSAPLIGVVGLGLIGGSIAKRLIGRYNIIGVDVNPAAVDYALKNGIADIGGTDYNILKGCGVIFVCAPAAVTGEVINACYRAVGTTAVITDVASVKKAVADVVIRGCRYVGGHPMAGSEKGGAEHSKAHLFENAFYILCPSADADNGDLHTVRATVEQLGAIIRVMDAGEHDRAVCKISHLPHMAAYALTAAALENGPQAGDLAAGGFRDFTRIASSDPGFWANVALLNKENIILGINDYIASLSTVRKSIAGDDIAALKAFFAKAKSLRDGVNANMTRHYRLDVDVLDRVGSISALTAVLAKRGIGINNISVVNSREDMSGTVTLQFKNKEDCTAAYEILRKKKYIVNNE